METTRVLMPAFSSVARASTAMLTSDPVAMRMTSGDSVPLLPPSTRT